MTEWQRIPRKGNVASHWVLATQDGTYSIWMYVRGAGRGQRRHNEYKLIGPHGLRMAFGKVANAKAHVAEIRGQSL